MIALNWFADERLASPGTCIYIMEVA